MSNLPQFTLEELAKYNGETDPKIYISMGGNVFDVTDAKFYGKGANYHVFAGTDFTVCLIKSSLDKAMTNIMDVANHGIADSAIESKINFYKGKYQRVGTLKEWVDVHGSKFIYE